MSFLGVGINGVVQVNSVAVANLKNASFSIKNDTVEEFVCGTGSVATPALLANTNQHYEIKADQLWTDNNLITLAGASAGTSVTIIIGPQGTATGKQKYTFTGCVINQLDLKWDQKGAISDNFSAKAMTMAVGNF
jgi:hypothetical protein